MRSFLCNKKLFFILAIVLGTTGSAVAEYRVYQYYVKSRLNIKRDVASYLVTSTLDPVSYLSYHGGNDSIKIDLLRTWMCPGFTGMFKDICDGPLEKLKQLQAQEEANGN